MYSSDTQSETRDSISLLQSDIDAEACSNEYELGKETLITEVERLQDEQMIAEIEHLKIEELEIELSQLKWCSLYKLQQLLKQQNFPHAIASIDSLAQRLPNDTQVREWQARAYLGWGRKLSKEKNLKKARNCFNKALAVLPNSNSSRSQIQQEIHRLNELC